MWKLIKQNKKLPCNVSLTCMVIPLQHCLQSLPAVEKDRGPLSFQPYSSTLEHCYGNFFGRKTCFVLLFIHMITHMAKANSFNMWLENCHIVNKSQQACTTQSIVTK